MRDVDLAWAAGGKNKGNPNTEELSWLKRQLSDLKRTP